MCVCARATFLQFARCKRFIWSSQQCVAPMIKLYFILWRALSRHIHTSEAVFYTEHRVKRAKNAIALTKNCAPTDISKQKKLTLLSQPPSLSPPPFTFVQRMTPITLPITARHYKCSSEINCRVLLNEAIKIVSRNRFSRLLSHTHTHAKVAGDSPLNATKTDCFLYHPTVVGAIQF